MVVIVPSGEFFFTKNKQKKKSRLGLTSTYEYKTIHTSVWMLPQGRLGIGMGMGGVIPCSPALLASPRLCHTGVTTREGPPPGRLFPPCSKAHRTIPSSIRGLVMEMEAGQQWER